MATPKSAPDAFIPQEDIDSPAGDAATLESMIQGDGPMLLGISGKEDDRTAIILSRDGTIERAKRGDTTSAGTVLAVGDDQVQLQLDYGRVMALALPR